MKKTALVTGANKGIGLEVASQLARDGYRVLAGARDVQRGETATAHLRQEGLDVKVPAVDLNRAAETGGALARAIADEYGRLDVLINNAGIVDPGDGLPSQVSIATLRRIFETTFFGTVIFTQTMLPLLRAAGEARIVNVSSGLGSLATNADATGPFFDAKLLAYNASKAALNMFTVNLAYDLRGTKIKVNSVSPGYVATDLNGHSGPLTVQEGAVEIVRLARLPTDGPSGGFFAREGVWPW